MIDYPSLGYGYGILKSTNCGETWSNTGLAFNPLNITYSPPIQKIALKPSNPSILIALPIVASDSACYFRSTNGGVNWSRIVDNAMLSSAESFNNVVFAEGVGYESTAFIAGKKLWKSTNSGLTWSDITTQIHTTIYPGGSDNVITMCEISTNKVFKDVIYLIVETRFEADDPEYHILRSTNNGTTFILINSNYLNNSFKKFKFCIISSECNQDIYYVGGLNFYSNTIQNNTPYYAETHADIRSLSIYHTSDNSENRDVLLVGNDGGLNKIIYNETSWVSNDNLSNEGLNIAESMGVSSIGNRTITGVFDCGNFLFENDQIFDKNGHCGDGVRCLMDGNNIYGSCFGGPISIWRDFFDKSGTGSTASINTGYHYFPIVSQPNNKSIVYVGSYTLDKKLDYGVGQNTLVASFPTAMNQPISAIEISESNMDVMYVSFATMRTWNPNSGKLFKSVNSGTSWVDITNNVRISTDPPGVTAVDYTYISCMKTSNTNASKLWIGTRMKWSFDLTTTGYRKVLYSNDGGSTFTDISYNLPNADIYDIEYIKDSPLDEVIVATESGVYYRNNTMGNTWTRLGNNLPYFRVMDVDINYERNLIVAATFGRGVWQIPIPCSSYSTAINITTNTTWSTDKRINQNIFVKSGATLTITSKISLSSYSKIVIERGGKIVLNGGKLTNSCGGLWKGVEVWGTSNKSQYTPDLSYQGQLEILNGGSIENAEVAVFLGKRNAQGLNETYYEGGILKANGATFKNNKIGVIFNSYHNYWPYSPYPSRANQSYFSTCTFETNSDLILNYNQTPETFVKLIEVEGISFKGCNFINSSPSSYLVYNRGKGIVATDAYCYVEQYCSSFYPCSNPINCTFSNLYYAIDASKTWWDDVLSIKYATFNSNYRGIYISSILNPIVMNNTFNIPDYDHSIDVILPTNNQPYGLYLNQSTGYTVENNSFNSSTSNKSTKHGVIVNYSGTANNRIYNNTFTALSVGTAAQGQNRGTNTGLVYKCNEFTNCNRDISIAPYSVFYGNVALYQGSLTEPVANLFSLAGTPFSDIYNESWTINYYHNTKPLRTARWVPVNYSTTSITLFNTNVAYDKTAQCPVTGEDLDKNLNNSYSNVNSYSSEINIIENQLNNLVDGGNTMLLLDEITNSPSWDALNLRNSLLTKSPFLSDTVLISAVENESVLPPVMLTQVLTANPHGIKSEEVKESLENRQNTIPPYLMTEIENSHQYISAKEHIESKLIMLRNKRAVDINNLITELKQDSINSFASDSICSLMGIEKTKNTTFNQYLRMLQVNKLENAAQYYNLILESNDNDIVFLATLARDLKSNYKVLDSLSSEDYLALIQIANNEESSVKGIARNLMLRLNLIEYAEPIYEINTSEEKSKTTKETKNNSDSNVLKIYPNPAKDYLIVYFKAETENCIIEVCDMFGRNLYSQKVNQKEGEIIIETKSFISGNYFVKLQSKGNTIKTEKVNISNK